MHKVLTVYTPKVVYLGHSRFTPLSAVLTGMGGFGSAYFIVVMGVHTFNTLVLRHRQPNWLIAAFLILGLVGMIAIGMVSFV